MKLPDSNEAIIDWLVSQSEHDNQMREFTNSMLDIKVTKDMLTTGILNGKPNKNSAKIIIAIHMMAPEPPDSIVRKVRRYLEKCESYTGQQAQKKMIAINAETARFLLTKLFMEKAEGEKREKSIAAINKLETLSIIKIIDSHKKEKILLGGVLTKAIIIACSNMQSEKQIDSIENEKDIDLSYDQRNQIHAKIKAKMRIAILSIKAKMLEMSAAESKLEY